MQCDTVDALTVLQSHELPAFTAINGFEYSTTDGCGVPHIALTAACPDDIGVGLVDGDRTNGRDRLIIKNRVPGQATVIGNPYAAGCRTDHDMVRV